MQTKTIKVGGIRLTVPDDGEHHSNWQLVEEGIKLLRDELAEERAKRKRAAWMLTRRRRACRG